MKTKRKPKDSKLFTC